MVAVAAEPEEKARPNLPCSRAATACSKPSRLGLADREYSYSPTGWAAALWAKVVDREMAGMTAPVVLSWGAPACTARVPNPDIVCVVCRFLGGVEM